MAWLAVDKDGTEIIYHNQEKPFRGYYQEYSEQWIGIGIELPKGSIKKLIGRELTWEDEPIKLE